MVFRKDALLCGKARSDYARTVRFSSYFVTLLFITQKLHTQDVFGALWIREFLRKGYQVQVICLEGGDIPFVLQEESSCSIHSLEKERGVSRLRQIFRFWKLILTLHYDRVFIHMSPVWGGLGAWWFWPRRVPTYLWYTHYKMQWGLRVLGWYAKRMFCATAQSLPQYERSPKKVVTGHGIDLDTWPKRENQSENPHRLLVVHRLSRSKRLEITLRALADLPQEYTLDVYGIEAEPDYVAELQQLVDQLQIRDRVTFHGTVPMDQLPLIYEQHRFVVNMASETIDKTMLEAMTCGCYPVTTLRNAEAIGLSDAPAEETAESLRQWILDHDQAPLSAEEMYRIVEERHSLRGLIAKMDAYIREGN